MIDEGVDRYVHGRIVSPADLHIDIGSFDINYFQLSKAVAPNTDPCVLCCTNYGQGINASQYGGGIHKEDKIYWCIEHACGRPYNV